MVVYPWKPNEIRSGTFQALEPLLRFGVVGSDLQGTSIVLGRSRLVSAVLIKEGSTVEGEGFGRYGAGPAGGRERWKLRSPKKRWGS